MYTIYLDDGLLYMPEDSSQGNYSLLDGVLQEDVNSAGTLKITIPTTNSKYADVKPYKTIIKLYEDRKLIWKGRVIEKNTDFKNNLKVTVEGVLAYLNDSIQRQAEYHDVTVRGFLEILLSKHNAQVEEEKHFKVGMVTVTDPNDSLYRYTNCENTMQAIKEKLVDSLGGYLFIRFEKDGTYIDYLKEMPNTCSQSIEFGENLLDYASNIDTVDICTRLVPQGAILGESSFTSIDERLTISSVNNGIDYVQSDEAVAEYGIITKVHTWDDVNVAENLLKKAKSYLETVQWESMMLTVTAVDLHAINKDIQPIHVGDNLYVTSVPHGMKRWFPVTSKITNIFDASKNKITLGSKVDVSLSAKANKTEKTANHASTFTQSSVLENAKDNASEMIKNATSGYIKLNMSEDGHPYELLIMDTDNIETATRVWRWNLNGLGYSNNGYEGTYGLAMTMDGSIVADFITTGTMTADRIRGGKLQMGGYNNKNGIIEVYDEEDNKCLQISKDGTRFYSGKTYIGNMGSLKWGSDEIKSLSFNLAKDGGFMAWFTANEEDTAYVARMILPMKEIPGTSYTVNALNLGATIDMRSNTMKNAYFDGCKVETGKKFTVQNDCDIEFYSNLNMNGYEIQNLVLNDIYSINGKTPVTQTYKVVTDVKVDFNNKTVSTSTLDLIFTDGLLSF